jgi:hypothetical protein
MGIRGSLIDKIVLGISIVLILALVCIIISSSFASSEIINLKTENKNYSKEQVENNSFFDIFITIPQNYEKVAPGAELLTNVKLINLGGAGRVDVLMNYEIKDVDDSPIITKKETVAVETQANFVRTFVIPLDAEAGAYKVYVKLVYADGKEAAAEASFEIVKASNQKTKDYFIYGSLAVIILAILIYLSIKSKAIIDRLKMKLQIRSIVKKKLG